ncbi:MAG: NFACT family protein [Clostridia bacterium]|nr:NFACT family protein [Clostridia bacterium]
MPQDAFTLRYLCEELNGILKGGKINRVAQPDSDITVFTVYTSSGIKKLILDVNPACPRIGLSESEPPSGQNPSNFCMLLKKHILSATIKGLSLVGFDRVVKIELLPSTEFFDSPEKIIYVELMGRYSNVILTENGKVLGGNRGINFLDNNVRPLIAGLNYRLPPVGDKKEPSDCAIKEIFDSADKITAENLCKFVQGLANSTAQEIADGFNADETLKGAVNIGEKFYGYLNDYIYRTVKRPCVLTDNGEIKDVFVYPYKNMKGVIKEYGFLCDAEDAYFAEKTERKRFGDLRSRLSGIVSAGLKKCKKRHNAVLSRLKDAENAEENRLKGELILSNIYKIKTGETEAELDNYYDGTKIVVALDKKLSPSKNAEAYYKKYNKQKRSLASLTPQKESAEEEVRYLESVESELSLCDSLSDLKAVEEELALSGFIRKPSQRKGTKTETEKPRIYDIYGFNVKVGRNNAENDKITFSAKPWDLWLHAKEHHSSHLVLETGGKKIPDRVLVAAAEICAYYSQGREGGKTEIAYCERKFVKKPKRSPLGFCTYTNFKSLIVQPNVHVELLKQ